MLAAMLPTRFALLNPDDATRVVQPSEVGTLPPLKPKIWKYRVREGWEGEGRMLATAVAAKGASRAHFCLCPTGDSKGLTARFYFAIAHECIPVRVDGFRRGLAAEQLALPFPSLIDWKDVVLDVPPASVAISPDAETKAERAGALPSERERERTREGMCRAV